MTSITISLPEKMKGWIEQECDSQGFGTVSEYVRALVRAAQVERGEIKLSAMLLHAMEPPATAMTKDDWAELRSQLKEHDVLTPAR